MHSTPTSPGSPSSTIVSMSDTAHPPSQSLDKNLLHLMKIWSACVIGPETLITVVCIFRLRLRSRTNGLWWDDYLAFVASVVVIPFFATTWLILIVQEMPHPMQTAFFWIHLAIQIAVICLARISLALSMARILPPASRIFRVTIAFSWIYALCALGSFLQFFAFPEYMETAGEQLPSYSRNRKTYNVIILPYTTDFASDIFLVSLALSQFWHVKLRSRGARILVLTGFCASLLVSPVSFVVGLLCIIPAGLTASGVINRTMCTHISVCSALLACNFLVVTSYVYQLVHKEDEELISELTALSRKPTKCATSTGRTIDSGALNDSHSSEVHSDPFVLTDVESDWSTSQLRTGSSKEGSVTCNQTPPSEPEKGAV
ncbi:hypothetical protein CPB83DRAFT_888889 [Crepidotus variabilis]|uniref:Integral membrane protein n=1 Tax=Crepidotus variabilis TaxID=179855 RepID=A0A9P6ETV7_9AGAR|nr:hypothetical protein CPB83DRAFT_888889 [Crepidotus variabilis]